MTKKVLKFSATWCSPCKMLSSTLKDVTTSVPVEEVDIDENMELAKQYGIRGVPTLVMLDEGKEVKRVSGVLMKTQLEEWFNS